MYDQERKNKSVYEISKKVISNEMEANKNFTAKEKKNKKAMLID